MRMCHSLRTAGIHWLLFIFLVDFAKTLKRLQKLYEEMKLRPKITVYTNQTTYKETILS